MDPSSTGTAPYRSQYGRSLAVLPISLHGPAFRLVGLSPYAFNAAQARATAKSIPPEYRSLDDAVAYHINRTEIMLDDLLVKLEVTEVKQQRKCNFSPLRALLPDSPSDLRPGSRKARQVLISILLLRLRDVLRDLPDGTTAPGPSGPCLSAPTLWWPFAMETSTIEFPNRATAIHAVDAWRTEVQLFAQGLRTLVRQTAVDADPPENVDGAIAKACTELPMALRFHGTMSNLCWAALALTALQRVHQSAANDGKPYDLCVMEGLGSRFM